MRATTFLSLTFLFAIAGSRTATAGTAYCFGDGTGTACPCGNNESTGTSGCLNSASPPAGPGAILSDAGSEVLLTDSVVLTVTGMPPTTAVLFFQGTAKSAAGAGVVFGDGLRCAGGTIVRLGIKLTTTGTASYPGTGEPQVHVKGGVIVAGTRYYQCWFRDAQTFCTTAPFNLSNGLDIAWT